MVTQGALILALLVDVMVMAPVQGFQRSPAEHAGTFAGPWEDPAREDGQERTAPEDGQERTAPEDGQERTASEGAPTAREGRVLDVAYFSSAQLSEEVQAAIVAEVERVFAEIGFQVRTHDVDELSGSGGPDPATLLRLVIREQSAKSWGINPAALGAMIGRQVPPTAVYLFASPIRRALGIANKPDGYLSAESVGRAFARVAVHEIVHAYAPDHPHSGWGITGHAQDARSLTQAGLMLDERAARAFAEGWQQIMAARQQIVQR